ncbi:hypothetical protein FNV43_RR02652 [Rhamnella rubrinervis]|uniref:RNase H type-1 domain-containing protein n=1 Tax=Rhamnella rubrinervis TaxID=2594499 RepID=A0A8K0HSI2_9ROSA|nr:hypothetical protein FNV43_RR02652 [Rhamnella rubrinervis]
MSGFIKVNVDAAYVDGRAAAALVIRNDQGHLLYLASKLFKCVSPFVAEVEALCWAADYVETCAWRMIEWETDAKDVETAVKAKEDPSNWYAYYPICSIRSCFERQGWRVTWKNRRSNLVADAVAKMSLSRNCAFVFYEYSLEAMPPCILNLIYAEQANAV